MWTSRRRIIISFRWGIDLMKMQIDFFKYSFPNRKSTGTKSHLQLRNLYSLEDFKLHLAVEKRRAERVNYKSSIVFFNVKHLVSNNIKRNKIRIEDVAKIICTTIRMTDVVTLYKNRTLLILMLDTSCQGAQVACKRIINKIFSRYSALSKLTHDDFHIKILSFPEKEIEESDVDSLDTLETNFDKVEPLAPEQRFPNEISFKKVYLENLSLCISSFNGSAIAMRIDDTFFWDQELLSKFYLASKKTVKKIMDIVGSATALLLLSPIMLIIGLIIKLTSAGPALFKQQRVGYKGQYFTFLKFRSMRAKCEDNMHQDYVKKLIQGANEQINCGTEKTPCYKMKNDPRITPFGRFLRKTSLDELPQLFNVLKGDMSLVGPRPPIPYEVNEYKNWHYRRVLDVKPGITGLWQVSGRNNTSFDDMVRLDIKYAENWSLRIDLGILLKTIKVVLAANGE